MGNMFRDRREAGRLLAEALVQFKDTDTVVLALPRGGVPVAEGGVRYIDENIVRSLGLSENQIAQVMSEEAAVLKTRIELFRSATSKRSLVGKTALIIDDGLATGATARAACKAARQLGARRVVVAVPVGPMGSENSIPEANEVICLSQPASFSAVGRHFESFDQVSDSEVLQILERRNEPI